MTAAEDKRARSIERIEDLECLARMESDQRGKPEQQGTEKDQRDGTHRAGYTDFERVSWYSTGV
ncbi:hypothetical protein PTKU64_14820 [Paraburkholderia terrae]|uniref:Uncharacterized protein n=1 Tax=Paraburkholderia terrae TaxID=311230 RepID=A0ABN6JAB2_9BURK|nr:hypothetical protein PTKU64_14820 [Paraburkholderia terrae]